MLRLLRLSIQSTVELAVTAIFGLSGLTMLLGTIDEYKAGKAFDRAMDHYAADNTELLHDALDEAMAAKPDYTAPLEAKGKLLIDDGLMGDTANFGKALELFQRLYEEQSARRRSPTLPVCIGRAVAQLESVMATNPAAPERHATAAKARTQLEDAQETYPESGDLYVNLATVALLNDDYATCEHHLATVRKVGNISIDALPFLYNLRGLVALRKGALPKAVSEFEKATCFAPLWNVPRLNLAGAYAQRLLASDLPPGEGRRYAENVKDVLRDMKGAEDAAPDLCAAICQSLAIYYVRNQSPEAAVRYLAQAKEMAELDWHGRFNSAVASYLIALSDRDSGPAQKKVLQNVRAELRTLVTDPRARRVNSFMMACMLGTLDALLGDTDTAVDHFEQADQIAAASKKEHIRQSRPRIQRTLGALHLQAKRYTKALEHLKLSTALAEQKDELAKHLEILTSPPNVDRFTVQQTEIATPHDLRFGARLLAPATPEPIDPEKVTVRLTNALTGRTETPPFRLFENCIRGVMVNLPQGKFTLEVQFTDAMGNVSEKASESFAIDREPPRIVGQHPAPGAKVAKLDAVAFRVVDAVSTVNTDTLTATLTYPKDAPVSNRFLVLRGKYQLTAKDNSVRRGDPATPDVRCPVPDDPVPGQYTITVRVQDSLKKPAEASWSFTVAP